MTVKLPAQPNILGLYRFFPPFVYGPEPQNPAPFNLHGQIDLDRVRALADQIVRVFLNSLPSNYISQTKGPYYVQQFQAVAEELAKIQVLLADAYEDSDYDFTRTEVLYQFLATLVFPDAPNAGLPEINGDISYREFLKRMVALLLQGSKGVTLVQGVEALTDANITLLQKVLFLDEPGVLWTMADQFAFEVSVEKYNRTLSTTALSVTEHYHTVTVNALGAGQTVDPVYASGSGPAHAHSIVDFVVIDAAGTGQSQHTHDLLSTFPDLPVVLQRNVALVLQALSPAATLYEYRNLFRENLRGLITDQVTAMDLTSYYYEDFRHDCSGIRALTGTNGVVGADRYLFHDPTLSFRSVRLGAELVVPVVAPSPGTPRENRYRVTAVVPFPYGDDPVPRAYTTSPTGLTGFVTVSQGAFTDAAQNFALCVEGETLTITTGPNAGTYLLETLLGLNGGPVGFTGGLLPLGPSTSVRPAPSYLRVLPRIMTPGTGISYTVNVDHLGVRVPIPVANEDVAIQFFGDGVLTFNSLSTSLGPLVKPWGDGTPAEVSDVTVLYDGVPVTVSALNPYTGVITLAAPITSFAPGAHTVTVSYTWFPSPVEGLKGLNTKGLTLNKWSLRRGRNATTTVLEPSSGLYGGLPSTRFQMGVALGRYPRRLPSLQIAHRFIGFEKGYTASLNSPTTMLLNQAPGRVSVPYAVADVSPQSFRFEGEVFPTFPWVDVGTPQGFVSDDGYYTLVDNSPTTVAYWKRDFPLPTSTNVSLAARIQVNKANPDGVFTGVGFGFHNNQRLFFVGALEVPNPLTGEVLRHVGILLRPGEISSVGSWKVGPSAEGRVQRPEFGATQGVVTVPTTSLPTLLSVGDKFQVLTGTQTGVYTVEDFYQSSRTGQTFLVVSPVFPANPELFGNRDVTLYFDTPWDEGLSTWRMYANTRSQTVTVVFGGASGSTTSVGTGILASPAYLGPDILPEGFGRMVWGSIDRAATNDTTWDFVRVASTPDGAYTYARGTVVDSQWATATVRLTALPLAGDTVTLNASAAPVLGPVVTLTAGTNFAIGSSLTATAENLAAAINASVLAPNYLSATSAGALVTITTNSSGSPGASITVTSVSAGRMVPTGFTGTATDPEHGDWYLATPFGDTRTSGASVAITSTPADAGLGTYYGYGYTDPFLTGRRVSALDGKFTVARDTAGVGGSTLVMRDTHREARAATLRYENQGALGKRIHRLDTVSLVGSVPYHQQGWEGNAGGAFPNGPEMLLTGDGNNAWSFYRTLVPYYSPCVGRFLEFRVALTDFTLDGAGRCGLTFAGTFGGNNVYLDFRAGCVVLSPAPNGGAVVIVTIPWDDGAARTYRLVYNVGAATVDLFIEGTLQATVPIGAFGAGAGQVQILHDAPAGGSFSASLRSVCYGGTEEGIPNLFRTMGLFLGGDEADINNWALPRTDGLNVPNSDPSSTITSMDWSVRCWVRLFMDPTFGATLIRPDLPAPPGYANDFATQSLDPTAGWVRVEYGRLPRVTPTEKFGTALFGPLNPSGSVLSVWDDVRYRVFTNTSVDYSAPQGMVLNRWNVVNSGDYLKDTTPQEVVVASVTPQRVSLRPCHIFADRVFAVRVDGATLPFNLWRFNKDSQELTLSVALPTRNHPVNVVFAPAKPVTNTYLQSQPFPESQTILNEGTPTFQQSQAGSAPPTVTLPTDIASTASGDGGPTPALPVPVGTAVPLDPDYAFRDQYLVRRFDDDPEYLYERLEFFQIEDGGQRGRLSSYCEGGPGPNGSWGATEFAFAGSYLNDNYAGMGAVGRGRGPGTYRYALLASGNGFDGGPLGTYSFITGTGTVIPFSGQGSPTTTNAEPRMLYAVGPSDGVVRGTDEGTTFRQTLFVLRTGAAPGTVSVWVDGSQQQVWG